MVICGKKKRTSGKTPPVSRFVKSTTPQKRKRQGISVDDLLSVLSWALKRPWITTGWRYVFKMSTKLFTWQVTNYIKLPTIIYNWLFCYSHCFCCLCNWLPVFLRCAVGWTVHLHGIRWRRISCGEAQSWAFCRVVGCKHFTGISCEIRKNCSKDVTVQLFKLGSTCESLTWKSCELPISIIFLVRMVIFHIHV